MKIYRWWGMASLTWFVLATAVAATGEPSATDKQTKAERLETILTETLPESAYRDTTRCLWANAYRSVEVLSDRYLIFQGKRDRVWINRLRNRCRGLRNDQILVFKRYGTRLCDTDQVSGSSRGFGISASCMLGEFEEIDEQRANALKEAFRQARRS